MPNVGKSFVRGHYSRTPAAKAGYEARRLKVTPRNPSGLCQCGCGQPAPIATKNAAARGYRKGDALPFIRGHYVRNYRAEQSPNWKGGRLTNRAGYVLVYAPQHPAAKAAKGYVLEHRLVMEQVLGRRLKRTEHVHHINGDPADNRPRNLIVLSKRDHHLLHQGESFRRFYAENPDARSANGRAASSKWPAGRMSELGKLGAAARWGKRD